MSELLVILLITGVVLVMLGAAMGGLIQVLTWVDLVEIKEEPRNEALDAMFRKSENE